MQNIDRVGDELAKAYEEGYKKGLEEHVPVDLGAQSGRSFKRIDKDCWGK